MIGFVCIRRYWICSALWVLGNGFVPTSLASNIPPDIRSIHQEICLDIPRLYTRLYRAEEVDRVVVLKLGCQVFGALYYAYPSIQNYPILRKPFIRDIMIWLWNFYPIGWWMGWDKEYFYCSMPNWHVLHFSFRMVGYMWLAQVYLGLKVNNFRQLYQQKLIIWHNKKILFHYWIYNCINQQLWVWILSRLSYRAGYWLQQLPIQITYILSPNLSKKDYSTIISFWKAQSEEKYAKVSKIIPKYLDLAFDDNVDANQYLLGDSLQLEPITMAAHALSVKQWQVVHELHLTFYKTCTLFYQQVKSIEFLFKFLDKEPTYAKAYGFSLLPQSWNRLPNSLLLGGTLGMWHTQGRQHLHLDGWYPMFVLLGKYQYNTNISVYFKVGSSTQQYVMPQRVMDFGISYIFL